MHDKKPLTFINMLFKYYKEEEKRQGNEEGEEKYDELDSRGMKERSMAKLGRAGGYTRQNEEAYEWPMLGDPSNPINKGLYTGGPPLIAPLISNAAYAPSWRTEVTLATTEPSKYSCMAAIVLNYTKNGKQKNSSFVTPTYRHPHRELENTELQKIK